jgi:hypothetical protein
MGLPVFDFIYLVNRANLFIAAVGWNAGVHGDFEWDDYGDYDGERMSLSPLLFHHHPSPIIYV